MVFGHRKNAIWREGVAFGIAPLLEVDAAVVGEIEGSAVVVADVNAFVWVAGVEYGVVGIFLGK